MFGKKQLYELLAYAAIIVVGTGLLVQFDTFDRMYEFTRANENWELDEFILAVPMIVVCLAVFAFRRARELDAAKAELAETHAQLMEMNRSRERFIAVSCHELRSPLNGIVHALSLMEMNDSPEDRQESIDFAKSAAGELSALIDGVLEFARLKNDAHGEHREFSPRRLLESVSILARLQAESKDLEFLTSVEDNVPETVVCKEAALRLAVLNLVGNAIKYTDEGLISVNMAFSNGHLITSVTDTGIGIPQDKLETVFMPYTKGNPSSGSGLGLGLAIVNRLTLGMDGTIFLSSEEGKGSQFSIKVPVDIA